MSTWVVGAICFVVGALAMLAALLPDLQDPIDEPPLHEDEGDE